MTKNTKVNEEVEKWILDCQLDDELHHTFPASDAPKITRTPGNRFTKPLPAEIAASHLPPLPLRYRRG